MKDFVFAEAPDGLRFVGDFDGLYASDRDPWQQSERGERMRAYYAHSRSSVLGALCGHGVRGPGLEVGCGLGFLTKRLDVLNLWSPVVGLDVSAKAIERAKAKHPKQMFVVGDVSAPDFVTPGRFGFVLWAQVLWYVLHRLDVAIDNSIECVEPGGFFLLSQAFLVEQRYGRDIVDGFYGALAVLSARSDLRLVEARYDDTDRLPYRDGLLMFRKV